MPLPTLEEILADYGSVRVRLHKPSNVCLHFLHDECHFGDQCKLCGQSFSDGALRSEGSFSIHIGGQSWGNKDHLRSATKNYTGPALEDWDDETLAPICASWRDQGRCSNGDNCRFQHGRNTHGDRLVAYVREKRRRMPREMVTDGKSGAARMEAVPLVKPVPVTIEDPETKRMRALLRLLARSDIVARISFFLMEAAVHADKATSSYRAQRPGFQFVARRHVHWSTLTAACVSKMFWEAFSPHLYAVVDVFCRARLEMLRANTTSQRRVQQMRVTQDVAMAAVIECLRGFLNPDTLTSLHLVLSPTRYTIEHADEDALLRALGLIATFPHLRSIRLVARMDGRLSSALCNKIADELRALESLQHLHLVDFELPIGSLGRSWRTSVTTLHLVHCGGKPTGVIDLMGAGLREVHVTDWMGDEDEFRVIPSMPPSCAIYGIALAKLRRVEEAHDSAKSMPSSSRGLPGWGAQASQGAVSATSSSCTLPETLMSDKSASLAQADRNDSWASSVKQRAGSSSTINEKTTRPSRPVSFLDLLGHSIIVSHLCRYLDAVQDSSPQRYSVRREERMCYAFTGRAGRDPWVPWRIYRVAMISKAAYAALKSWLFRTVVLTSRGRLESLRRRPRHLAIHTLDISQARIAVGAITDLVERCDFSILRSLSLLLTPTSFVMDDRSKTHVFTCLQTVAEARNLHSLRLQAADFDAGLSRDVAREVYSLIGGLRSLEHLHLHDFRAPSASLDEQVDISRSKSLLTLHLVRPKGTILPWIEQCASKLELLVIIWQGEEDNRLPVTELPGLKELDIRGCASSMTGQVAMRMGSDDVWPSLQTLSMECRGVPEEKDIEGKMAIDRLGEQRGMVVNWL